MKTVIERDLADAVDAIENMAKYVGNLSLKERVDICARLKSAAKSIEKMESDTKDDIRKKLKHKDGTVNGEMFKAILKLVPTTRLDQKGLKEHETDIFEAYNKDATDERVTFEPR